MTEGEDRFRKLLEKARSGEREAWDELFSRLADEGGEEGAAVLSIARKVLPRDHWARNLIDSRDVVQSALRVGWIKAEQFEGSTEKEFFGWLRAILRSKVGRATRRGDQRPHARAEVVEEIPEPSGEERSPLALVIEEEVKSRVQAALGQLPEDQRAVMDLSLQGLKGPEIARILDLKPATVRKRESRAAERIRELLGEQGGEGVEGR
jgi:RNA polymerase sigma-70 factor, ECF subfamily